MPMSTIKVLGPGCANCQRLTALTEQALAELGQTIEVEKVTDYAQIAAYGVMSDREAYIAGLRAVADFIDQHPELPTPWGPAVNVFVSTREQLVQTARLPGVSWEKGANGGYFYLKRAFGHGISYEVNVAREQVCKKVLTGTRFVPAQAARQEEIFEWECAESLLADGSEPALEAAIRQGQATS